VAARILEGQRAGASGEENLLAFEELPHVALCKTYNTNQQVSDSAGTMTAITTGVKTLAGVIGVGPSVVRGDADTVAGARLETLLETCEARGLRTGVVSTARLTHATPAACYAHSPERGWEADSNLTDAARAAGFPDIARQLVELGAGDGLEVALGGGRAAFLPREAADPEYPDQHGHRRDGRDLVRAWLDRHDGAAFAWNRADLAAVDAGAVDHLLGLFEPGHMQYAHDRDPSERGDPTLVEMTLRALDVLDRGDAGYFLMVEAGRIDHAHHAGNAYRALDETIELSDAVRATLERVDLDETLVIVTADHSHVLTFGGYATRGNPVLGLVRGNDGSGRPRDEPDADLEGLPYTTLAYANGPGGREPAEGRRDLSAVDTRAPDFRQPAAVPLWSETHAGEDVALYAGGPGAHLFQGVVEQNVVYHVMARALGLDEPAAPVPLELELERALPVEHADGSPAVDPSGLTLVDGTLFTVSDKRPDTIFRLDLHAYRAVLHEHLRFEAGGRDLEGITADDAGTFYVVSEADCTLLRVVPGGACEALTPSLEALGAAAGLFRRPGEAGPEALARLAPGRFVVGAEREERGLLRVDVAPGHLAVDARPLPVRPPVTFGDRTPDLAGLFAAGGELYGLARGASTVVRLQQDAAGAWHETAAWSYAAVENDPRFAYRDMRYGHGEGLAMDERFVYVILDVNAHTANARVASEHPAGSGEPDRRPLLLVLRRP